MVWISEYCSNSGFGETFTLFTLFWIPRFSQDCPRLIQGSKIKEVTCHEVTDTKHVLVRTSIKKSLCSPAEVATASWKLSLLVYTWDCPLSVSVTDILQVVRSCRFLLELLLVGDPSLPLPLCSATSTSVRRESDLVIK